MSLIRQHGAVLQAWACLALVFRCYNVCRLHSGHCPRNSRPSSPRNSRLKKREFLGDKRPELLGQWPLCTSVRYLHETRETQWMIIKEAIHIRKEQDTLTCSWHRNNVKNNTAVASADSSNNFVTYPKRSTRKSKTAQPSLKRPI